LKKIARTIATTGPASDRQMLNEGRIKSPLMVGKSM
jgi:hypothetical protein